MLEPVAFSIFGLDVHWYGIIYSLGFLGGYFFLLYYCKFLKISKDKMENIYLYFVLFSVLGGRLFEIIVYNPLYYLSNPFQVFAVWRGGMSIHGGILAGALVLIYFAKKYKINALKLMDLFVAPTALGLSFGRLANFVNQELVGTPTSSSLGVVFPLYDDLKRWPYQVFASVKNMVVFQILFFMHEFGKFKPGIVSAWFLILYNGGRFVLDFLREPTISLGIISIGQLLCLIYGFVGVVMLFKINLKYSS